MVKPRAAPNGGDEAAIKKDASTKQSISREQVTPASLRR